MEIKACSQRLVSPEISNSTRDRFQIRHAKVYTPASSRTTQNDFAYCQYTTAISSFDLDSFMHDCLEHIRIWHHVSFNSESDSQTSNNQPLSGSQSRSTARKWKRTWLSSLPVYRTRHCLVWVSTRTDQDPRHDGLWKTVVSLHRDTRIKFDPSKRQIDTPKPICIRSRQRKKIQNQFSRFGRAIWGNVLLYEL